ncbi:MAG: hypothetical protein JNJ40_03575 [Bacteroidia bacterium]|nr:hypothetical protein [Bacteroidia bacterium]
MLYVDKIELTYVTITYEAPIVYFIYKDGTELGFPEIKELVGYAEKLSKGKPYFTFSDVRVDINVTKQGKLYLEDLNNMPLFRGTAAWVKNSVYSFAANFMSSFSRKSFPFRAFTEKEKAIEWLKGLPLNE